MVGIIIGILNLGIEVDARNVLRFLCFVIGWF